MSAHTEGPLERNRAEEARLMQRINAAATLLQQLWSMDAALEPDQSAGRRQRTAALQAEIDELYARRRQLLAARTVAQGLRRVEASPGAERE